MTTKLFLSARRKSETRRYGSGLLEVAADSPKSELVIAKATEILVVFTDFATSKSKDRTNHNKHYGRWYFLKHGFGHCFMLAHYGDDWVLTDPLFSHIFQCKLVGISKSELIRTLRNNNCRILSCAPATLPPRRPLASHPFLRSLYPLWVQAGMLNIGLFSCVTVIKRALNIRSISSMTPYQLYLFLKRTKKEYI